MTESRRRSGNCECKSPWHSLKQGRKEGESAGEARNYSSVRCEDEEDLKVLHSTRARAHTHTPCGYQDLPLNSLYFLQNVEQRLTGHTPSVNASPNLISHPPILTL